MVRFTLKQCAYFIAVSEHGGISQAARVLNISQPSIAQALEKLESLTGLRLFERRHARGLELTAQGRSLLTHVKSLDDHAVRVEHEAALLRTGVAGRIRLGCFHTIAQFHLARLIREFGAAQPGILISAEEMPMDELTRAVLEGALDMAITYRIAPGLDALLVTEWAAISPHVILPEGHPLAGATPIRLRDLED